ncbi:thrombin inhibitor hemalin-like [Haliotis cracherodii]|uniref:thrombin inhibitor hemalin-like n=1 Tax=Haliotis cracherodii TaxID=6455 RepID=UPI0039E8574B
MLKVVVCLALVFLLFGPSQQRPSAREICNLNHERGRCRAFLRRVFYNPLTGQCESFTYGGCGGNANNFKNIGACEKVCKPGCQAKPSPGRCRGKINRFYYDASSQRCKRFIYHGCGGNTNNYQTRAACMRACGYI